MTPNLMLSAREFELVMTATSVLGKSFFLFHTKASVSNEPCSQFPGLILIHFSSPICSILSTLCQCPGQQNTGDTSTDEHSWVYWLVYFNILHVMDGTGSLSKKMLGRIY